MNEWVMMHGYGAYVWSAYGISFLLFFALLRSSQRKLGAVKHALRQKFYARETDTHVT